ncbi:hypothetical protein [Shinella sp. BYT-45]|uniref:hypothetical protein n=1 Tax=Shinella sp. BYT-45 TaxID=3377377 RepID=UPI00397EDBED
MRSQPADVTQALAEAPETGVATRLAVWIGARNRATGAIEELACWEGDDDAPLTVIRGRDGATVTRTYVGGAPLKIGDIVRSSDLTVQTLSIDLSQLADVVRHAVRTHDVARAPIEVHEIILSPETGRPLSADLPIFVGIIDGAPIKTPAAGGEGKVALTCRSELMALLDRGNPEKASYEAQLLRDGDEWNLYAGAVETWEIAWGQ